jgi:hypothetical protein
MHTRLMSRESTTHSMGLTQAVSNWSCLITNCFLPRQLSPRCERAAQRELPNDFKMPVGWFSGSSPDSHFGIEEVEVYALAERRDIVAPLPVLANLQSKILTDETHAPSLGRFLGDIPLPDRLLYRASRDGFRAKDWRERCTDTGPSLMVVKAKGSGNIFGSFLHDIPRW